MSNRAGGGSPRRQRAQTAQERMLLAVRSPRLDAGNSLTGRITAELRRHRRKLLGFVTDLAGGSSAGPTVLGRVRRPAFDGRTLSSRRCIGELAGNAVVADGNACGVSFDSTMLANVAVDESGIDHLRSGSEPADAAHASVYDFACETVVRRGKLPEVVVVRARSARAPGSSASAIPVSCVFASLVGAIDCFAELQDELLPGQRTPD
jgi:hypothetical protein